jgi:SAM-dependent methyltransferase
VHTDKRITSPVSPVSRNYRTEVHAIRQTRLRPRLYDYLYPHLRRLRNELRVQLETLPARDVLDVYCGARPYEPLLGPGVNYVGLDIDDAYGCADVISSAFLPFPDEVFDLCLCTQAFQFVPDAESAVAEFARVLRPGGHALLAVQAAFPRAAGPYTAAQLADLFSGWSDVSVRVNGGTAISTFTLAAWTVHQIERRLPRRCGVLFAPMYLALNLFGEASDFAVRRLPRLDAARPVTLVLRARRPC